MNKTVTVIAVIVIIILAGVLLFSADSTNQDNDGAQGTLYLSVTDAAADMENVTEVTMTTDSVEVHSESNGWVEATSAQKSFNLLQLNASGNSQLWTQTQLNAGTYDQVRLTIDNVTVTTTDGQEMDATLPSNNVTIDGTVNVEGGATSTTEFDVIADQSLHTATDGSYVFAPVIEMESRSNADVDVDENNNVAAAGGDVDADVTVGVDLAGKSGVGVSVDPGERIEVTQDGKVKLDIQPQEQGTSSRDSRGADVETSTDADADAAATSSVDTQGGADVQTDDNAEGSVEARGSVDM